MPRNTDLSFDDLSFDIDELLKNVKETESRSTKTSVSPLSIQELISAIQAVARESGAVFMGCYSHEQLDEMVKNTEELLNLNNRGLARDCGFPRSNPAKTMEPEKIYWYETIFFGQIDSYFTRNGISKLILLLNNTLRDPNHPDCRFIPVSNGLTMAGSRPLLIIREAGSKSPVNLYSEKFLFYTIRNKPTDEKVFLIFSFATKEDRNQAKSGISELLSSKKLTETLLCSFPGVAVSRASLKRFYPKVGKAGNVNVKESCIIPEDDRRVIEEGQEFIRSKKREWCNTISIVELKEAIEKDLEKTCGDLKYFVKKYCEPSSEEYEKIIEGLERVKNDLAETFGFPDWEAKMEELARQKNTYQAKGKELLKVVWWEYSKLESSNVSGQSPAARVQPVTEGGMSLFKAAGSRSSAPLNPNAKPYQPK